MQPRIVDAIDDDTARRNAVAIGVNLVIVDDEPIDNAIGSDVDCASHAAIEGHELRAFDHAVDGSRALHDADPGKQGQITHVVAS